MASKRKAFVHLGLDDGSGDFVDAALRQHAVALAELGVQAPAESAEQLFRAAVEILRAHREWGYKRSEVEGAWSAAVRVGLKGRDTLVFSQPLLASAPPEQAALLVDELRGFEVHLIVTVQAPDARSVAAEPARSLDAVLATWRGLVSTPQRLHVIIAPDRLTTWQAIGRTVGFGTASLRLDEVPDSDRPQIPVLATRSAALEALGRSWVELLTAGAHDVVGRPRAPRAGPGHRRVRGAGGHLRRARPERGPARGRAADAPHPLPRTPPRGDGEEAQEAQASVVLDTVRRPTPPISAAARRPRQPCAR